MLSSNNRQEQIRKQEPKKQRFTIKKLTVGVASVLIGFTFMGISASADTSVAPNKSVTSESTTPDDSTNGSKVVLKSSSEADTNKTNSSQDTSVLNPQQTSTAVTAPSQVATSKAVTQSQEVADWQGFVNAMNDSNVGTIKLTGDITVANKGTNINGITRPNPVVNSGKMNLTGENISRALTIDGQGHAIDFGENYLSFTTNNQKNGTPWDITFKNLTINADGYDNSWSSYGGAFSPIYMGGDGIRTDLLANNKVTFENVIADVKNGAFYNTTMAQQTGDNPYTTVTFKGNNNITCEAVNVAGNQVSNYSSAVSASHIIFADGTNTVFNVSSAKTNNDQNAGGNILRAKVEDEKNDTAPAIDVQQGATVTLNGKSTDVKGMLVNSAITGTVQVDGNLNANMADGHSMAIWAGNLNIGKTGVVNINTKQSNDGSGANGVTNYNGYHFAPISLGVGFAANLTNADSNVLDNQGKLIIIRTGANNQSTSPLISFGSGSGLGSKWDLNVHEGATLDLQDDANSSVNGAFTNTPKFGLVTMWGGGTGTNNSYNHVTIINPKYVNLQRTGNQTGTLLRLENQNNNVNISSAGSNLPFAQWDEANKGTGASYYWYLNNLQTQNNWGDNAISGFTQTGNTLGQNKKGEIKFLHSNGQVDLAQNQAGLNSYQFNNGNVAQGQPNDGVKYETPYLNRLLNNFNWWTPQRISMGTSLSEVAKPTDSDQYQPVVKTIDGNTKQTLSDLAARNGISGLRTSDGNITTDLSSVKGVSWYNATTDATEWQDLMNGEVAPVNPTGNLKTSDKSAWAKVTYTDGSVDFANIPLNITEPMADSYTPSYKPITVDQGKTATDNPTFAGQDGKTTTMPTGTTFKTSDNTPNWATVDPSTGTVTVKPGMDVTPDNYNIPVTVTYPDNSTDNVMVPVTVTDATKDNVKYPVSYDGLNVERPTTDTPVTKSENPKTSQEMPTGTIIGYDKGSFTEPTGVTTSVDKTTGKITITATKDALRGTFNVPVEVNYQDGTTATVYVPVSVTGAEVDPGGRTIYYGDQTSTEFSAAPTNLHKTSINNTPEAAKSGFDTITYNYDWDRTSGNGNYLKHTTYKLTADGSEFVNVADPTDKFAASDITYTWMNNYKPNTNFGNNTETTLANDPLEKTGQNDNLPGNSKYRYNFTVSNENGTATKLGLGFANYNSWCNVYFNFYGAKTGDALTFKQNSDISNLTQDQYRQLIDVTDLGKDGWNGQNVNPNAPQVFAYVPGTDNAKTFTMTWAPGGQPSTANVANGINGTVRIHFNDGTYLDVPANINVIKDADSGKQDQDKTEFTQKIVYTYNDKEVAYTTIDNIAKGSSLTANQLKSAINSNVPDDYTIASGYTYPGAINNIIATPEPIKVPLTLKTDATFNAQGQIVYQTVDGKQVGTGSKIESKIGDTLTAGLLHDLADQNVPTDYSISKYPSSFEVTNDTFTIPVLVQKRSSVTTTYNFYSQVTVKAPNGEVTKEPEQKLTFTYEGIPTDADVDVAFKDVPVPSYGGYTPEVSLTQPIIEGTPMATLEKTTDGKWTLKLPKPVLEHSLYYYTITYKKSGSVTPTEDTTVTYTFHDDTDNKPVGVPVTVSGKPGTTQQTGLTIPTGYKLAEGQGLPGTVTMPDSDESITIHLVHSTKPVTPTTPGVDPTNPKYKDMFKTVTRDIYQTKPGEAEKKIDTQSVEFGRDGIEDLVTGEVKGTGNWQVGTTQNNKFVLGGQPEFASMNAPQIPDYDSYVNGTKTTTVSSASALSDGQPVNGVAIHITYLKSGNTTPVPYDPSNKDMNKDVTRTITIYKTDGTTDIVTQNVHFVRGGEGQTAGTKDQNGNITWSAWTVATKNGDSWKSTGASEGSWKEYDVTPVDGYKSTVDGHEATKVDEETVNADTPDANVVVAYTKTTEPTNPSINPNKPGDKYKDMFANPTRTINVMNPLTNKVAKTEQTVWFGRTMTTSTDPNVAPTYGPWQLGKVENGKFVATPNDAAKWDEFTAPTFTDYTPSQSKVTEQDVTADTKNVTVDITYTKNGGGTVTPTPTPTEDTTVTYTFHDDTDNKTVGAPVVVSGKPGTTQDTNLAVPAGYKLAEGQTLPTTVTMPTSDENITIHLVHGTKTVTPGKPGVTPTNPSNPDYKNLFKKVTRTINVENPITDQTETHTQTVWFGRTGTYDEVTNKFTSYGDWYVYDENSNKLTNDANGSWAEFDAPEFTGYTPSQAKVEAETVTADTNDATVTITYKKDNGGKSTNPSNPTNPTEPSNKPGDNGANTNPGGNNGQPVNNGNGNNTGNVNGNGNGLNGMPITDNGNKKNNNANSLPQTSNNKSNAAAIAGLGLASLTAMLGLGGLKKKD